MPESIKSQSGLDALFGWKPLVAVKPCVAYPLDEGAPVVVELSTATATRRVEIPDSYSVEEGIRILDGVAVEMVLGG